MPGDIKAGLGTLIGNAGEYGVMSELLKRHVIAALAPRNAPSFDILATKDSKVVRIRVKTKTGAKNPWQFMAKRDGTIFRDLEARDDFIVLVALGKGAEPNRYFVLPTPTVDEWLKTGFQKWVDTPGKGGRPHNPGNRKRHLGEEPKDRLREYENAWDRLWVTREGQGN